MAGPPESHQMSRAAEDTKGDQGRTSREVGCTVAGAEKTVCVLPCRSTMKMGVRRVGWRVGVAGWEVIGWVVGGVGGAMVVSDALSTDRQEMGSHTQMVLSTTCG